MEIIEHTQTRLVLRLTENQILGLALQVSGVLIFLGVILLGVDFRTNPEYSAMSAQNLNLSFKIIGGFLALMALGSVISTLNNQDKAYIFDKITHTLTVEKKGFGRLFPQQHPFSSIKEVVVQKTFSPPDPQGYSDIPIPDYFYIVLRLENSTSDLVFQYRSPDPEFLQAIADTIQQLLKADA